MRLVSLLLLVATPVWAQVPPCVDTIHGPNDIRTECEGGGSYGIRQNQDGTLDEMRKGRAWKTFWLMRTWNSTRVSQPVMEADVIEAPSPAEPVEPAPVAPAGPTIIDYMVARTPRVERLLGGVSQTNALVVNAVARGNLSLSNSLVNARLRLVWTGVVNYIEGNITTDLGRLRGLNDGFMDGLHAIRNQVGADIVTLLGAGYAAQGAAGQGFRMTTPSPGFASSAFNVVDYSQASSNLSLPHEVFHNMQPHHDVANAGCGTTCSGIHYGYKVAGKFRTVMAYGSEPRIPYLSNPNVTYGGLPTGTATRYNAKVVGDNAAIIAGFRPEGTPVPVPTPPPCTYTVTPSSLTFLAAGGTKTVQVTTTSLCGWTQFPNASWLTITGGRQGSGPATVTVQANTGAERSVTARVAAQNVLISQTGQE